MLMMFKHLISNRKFRIKISYYFKLFFFFRLFDSENVTCDDNHMWLCPFNKRDRVRIIITLSVSKRLHGLRIWNYNKSSDDTYRGVCFFFVL
jgi:hypothetical protein